MEDPPNHFFKFIPPGFSFNLSIPKSFWINLKQETCKKAVLKRGRREWPVAISDKGVFGDGWRKLMIDNGVQECDFIVFKHQGKMLFDFMVFDQSTCERQYPNLLDEIDVEVHIHERSKKSKKRRRSSHLGGDSCIKIIMTPYNIKSSILHIPIKFARSNGLITEDTQNVVVHTKAVIVDEARRTWPATLQTNRRRVLLGGWRELKIKNQLKAGDSCMFELVKLGEVSVFSFYKLGKMPVTDDHIRIQKDTSLMSKQEINVTSNNHPYFNSTLKPSTFKSSGSCLYLPVAFSIQSGFKIGEMILRNEKGRSWKIQLRKIGEKSFYLGRGLKDFCDANGLKVGDAYKFELIENEKDKPPVVNFSLNVDRTMDVEEPLRGLDSVQKLTSLDALDVEEPLIGLNSNYTDRCPTQICKIKDLNHQKIENTVGKKPVENNSQAEVDIDSTKKETSSTLKSHPYFTWTLSHKRITKAGLYLPVEFSISNGLKLGEIILRYDSRGSWNVQLFKHREKTFKLRRSFKDFCVENGLKEGNVYKFETVEDQQDNPPVMNVSLYEDLAREKRNYPYFIGEVKSYIVERMMYYLPKNFARKNGLFNKEEMILKNVRNEGSWTVKLKSGKNNRYCYIGRGWKAFYVANGLKDGDLFKFELVDNDEKPTANFHFLGIS